MELTIGESRKKTLCEEWIHIYCYCYCYDYDYDYDYGYDGKSILGFHALHKVKLL